MTKRRNPLSMRLFPSMPSRIVHNMRLTCTTPQVGTIVCQAGLIGLPQGGLASERVVSKRQSA